MTDNRDKTISLEQAALCCLLIHSSEALPVAFELELTAEVFDDKLHKFVFNIIIDLYKRDRKFPDEIMLLDEFMALAGEAGHSAGDFQELTMYEVHHYYFRSYATKLIDRHYKKLLRESYWHLKGISNDTPDDDLEALVDRHVREREDAERFNLKKRTGTAELIEELTERANRKIREGYSQGGISMEFLDGFEHKLNPVERGEFVVLGARPSVGKTSLAVQLLDYNLMRGIQAVYFPLESDTNELVSQLVTHRTRLNFHQLHTYGVTEQQAYIQAIRSFEGVLGKTLFIHSNNKLESMDRFLQSVVTRHGAPGLIITDYIQLAKAGNANDTRTVRLGECSRMHKTWAGEYRTVAIALAQLGRAHTKGPKPLPPKMDDLRECGDLEQDANRVWLLDRPLLNHRRVDQTDHTVVDVDLIQPKNRFGSTGSLKLRFNKPLTTFTTDKENEEGGEF